MKITLGQYQQLWAIRKADLTEEEKAIESVAIIKGITTHDVEEMPVIQFKALAIEVLKILSKKVSSKPKRLIKVNSNTYGITYEPGKLTAGQYVELQHWLQGDFIDNLHLVLATLSYPTKKTLIGLRRLPYNPNNHKEVASNMQDIPFEDAYAACLFFCQLFAGSVTGLKGYLERELLKIVKREERTEKILELGRVMKDFQLVTDGYITALK